MDKLSFMKFLQKLLNVNSDEELVNLIMEEPEIISPDFIVSLRYFAGRAEEDKVKNALLTYAEILEGILKGVEAQQKAGGENPILYFGKRIVSGKQTLEETLKSLLQFPPSLSQINEAVDSATRLLKAGQIPFTHIIVVLVLNLFEYIDYKMEDPELWATVFAHLGMLLWEIPLPDQAQKMELCIFCYKKALEVFTLERDSKSWATIMHNLGIAYVERIEGDAAENLEEAIRCHKNVLRVREREGDPYSWGITMLELGTAYLYRIKGEKTDNLEKALKCFEESLEVITRETYPQQWVKIMHNLGILYVERIKGDKATNIEKAIQCYLKVLEEIDRENQSYPWALTMQELAIAYTVRIRGRMEENIEEAIRCYKAALNVRTRDKYPYQWAMTMGDLGSAYKKRIKGDRAENIEEAIRCYKRSLEVYKREKYPRNWALTMNNLGSAYRIRVKGNKAKNIEEAINFYKAALEIRKREKDPYSWGETIQNLGTAYFSRRMGDRAENLEKAVHYLKLALEVYTKTSNPGAWAEITYNLGSVYTKRIQGEKEENLEKAIDCYEATLGVITRETDPYTWATILNALGLVYKERIKEDAHENFEKAKKSFLQATKVSDSLNLPYESKIFYGNLADLYFENELYEKAADAYYRAEEFVERLRTEAIKLERRVEILRENIVIFERLIVSLMKLGRYEEALEVAERGKSRTLIDLLSMKELRPKNTSPEVVERYERLLKEIMTLEERLKGGERGVVEPQQVRAMDEAINRRLNKATEELGEVMEIIREEDPDFVPNAKPLSLPDIYEISKTADSDILLFRVTEQNTYIFAVHPDGSIHTEEVKFGIKEMEELLIGKDGWVRKYYDYLMRPTSERKNRWLLSMDRILRKLYDVLFLPIEDRLKTSKLIIVPNKGLSILPLHAAYKTKNGKRQYIIDNHIITYAPCLGVYKRCREREGREGIFLAFTNPDGTLPFAELEAAEAGTLSGKKEKIFAGADARESFLYELSPNSYILHLSTHGNYRLDSPFESSLLFAGRKLLTLGNILEGLTLSNNWLVVLSACETGLVDFTEIADEHFGLPIGFLYAGAPTVYASFWTVADLSTALLIVKAYENLRKGMDKPESLNSAQVWLKNLNREDAIEEIKKRRHWFETRGFVDEYASAYFTALSEEYPFSHPFYWAAFHSVGV